MTEMNTTVRAGLHVEDPYDLAWFQAHREAIDAAPGWATEASIAEETHDGAVGLGYDAKFGSVELGAASKWQDGSVSHADGGSVYLYFMANETAVTAVELREFAREFTAAAEALEAHAQEAR